MALPTNPPFDIYALTTADMPTLTAQPEVTYVGDPSQRTLDVDNDFILRSNGLTTNARFEIDSSIPQTFTGEVEFKLTSLPTNFGDVVHRHLLLGFMDGAGAAASLFISEVGLLYTGVVHHSPGNVLILDHPTQPLPNSQELIEKDVFYTLRLVVSYETQTTFIFWTKSSDVASIGHQLRYVVPTFFVDTAVTSVTDRSLFSVRGLATELVEIAFSQINAGTGLIMPNLRPIADAGADQALRSCSIAQFNGSASFDPEGAFITYKWRLVDAPITSQFAFESLDALTYPEFAPSGFTDHIYSAELQDEHAEDPIVAGDVIILNGETYEIVSTGIDGFGFYVDVGDDIVPDSYSTGQAFKLLRQRGFANPTTVNPTFLPDQPGLYKFDLVVFDGALYSEPALTVVNVTASPLPRGLIPDLKFMWTYLADFWKLVEDRERIEVFWSAFAQVAASEILTYWQTDYAKSLRDIQRTFQRRWLHFDLLIKEPSETLELSTLRAVYGGIESDDIPAVGIAGVANTTLELFFSTLTEPVVIYFPGSGTLTAQQICDRLNGFLHATDPRVVAKVIDSRDGTTSKVRIDGPFGISVSGDSTCTLFGVRASACLQGTGGVVVGSRTYLVDRSLAELDIQEGDLLTLDSGTYRIFRVIDDENDELFNQRITLLEDIPFTSGANWLISGSATSKSLDFYDALLTAGDVGILEVVDLTTNEISYATVTVYGVSAGASKTLGIDTSQIGHYLAEPELFKVFFYSATRRKYTPISDLIVDVPYLQERIKNTDDTAVLRRNIDYFLETFRGISCIRFIVSNTVDEDVWEGLVPPDRLWAELTYLDNKPVIEANFGIPAEFTLDDLSELPSNIDYLSAVRGLWYAYFSGPTLFNVRAGVQILLGLPYAEVESTIEEIRDDFSTTQGRLLLRDTKDTEIVRTYTYPHGLAVEVNPATGVAYVVGDTVKQFAPIITGVEVVDWVKSPRWFEGLLNQGNFTEIEKFFKFLVQVDSTAFNLSALLFVRQFILRIKPTYTLPVFIVRAELGDAEVSVDDVLFFKGKLDLHVGPYFGSDGQAQMFDQARPSYGGYWNKFDQDDPNGTAPTSPTPDDQVDWGFDEYLLAPREAAVAQLTTVWAGGIPTANSVFYADMPIFTSVVAVFVSGGIRNLVSEAVGGSMLDEDGNPILDEDGNPIEDEE